LVLAVVGTGIWLGVQHLNYLEFGELRRVAQRTIDQRQIVINNLSVRRAIEELKMAGEFSEIRKILVRAFENNDFDAFELHLKTHSAEMGVPNGDHGRSLHWTKYPQMSAISSQPSWKLSLDLVTASNQRRGSLVVYRMYSPRDLQLDVNLLTSEFPATLANAIDRISIMPIVLVPISQTDPPFMAANL
jgi:hypothetical protein